MPITRINPVSPRAQPVQEEKKSNFDKVMEALSLASTALSIPADIQKIRQYQSQIDLNEQRAITEAETRPEKIRTAISKREVEEIKGDIAKDEKKFRDAQDPIIRNIKNASDRDSLGKISNAYSALNDLENAIAKDVPVNTTVGSNLSTAARDRFVQFFGREVSGAAIADRAGILSFLGITGGAERQQFEALVPAMGDTVEAARTKIDEMKEALERMAITRGVPNAQEFTAFVERTGRPVKPLEKTPITAVSPKETAKKAEEAWDFGTRWLEEGAERIQKSIKEGERKSEEESGPGLFDIFKQGFFQDGPSFGPRGGASPKAETDPDVEQFKELHQGLKSAIDAKGSEHDKAIRIRDSLNQLETFLRSKTPNEKYPPFSPGLDAAKFDAVKKAMENFFKSRQGIGPQSSVAPGTGRGLAGLTGVADKKVVSKQGLGGIARAEKKRDSGF